MKIVKLVTSIVVVFALASCAHPIIISPESSKIALSSSDQPIKKNVAYYIADDLTNLEVITPGGGGDKISYKPYRDIELGFYQMLSNSFASVTKLKSIDDQSSIDKNKIDYIIRPVVTTDSSSPSKFTWPPTKFTVELSCDISDEKGNALFSKKVTGEGNAEFAEFKYDHALSGKRATEDALLKMQKTLVDTQELR